MEERLTYITCQKGTRVRLVKNLTLRGSSEDPRSLPREEKSTSPYLLFIYYKLQKGKEIKLKTKLQKAATSA
jgi:hypothetical protein